MSSSVSSGFADSEQNASRRHSQHEGSAQGTRCSHRRAQLSGKRADRREMEATGLAAFAPSARRRPGKPAATLAVPSQPRRRARCLPGVPPHRPRAQRARWKCQTEAQALGTGSYRRRREPRSVPWWF